MRVDAPPVRILLAPMEGLLDFVLRDTLTRLPGIDHCVSEFIRITDQLLPDRVFTRIVPELLHGGRTPSGVPVRAQLLGSDPVCLAENAARLAALGPFGIDLNFGCPAKLINRHGGGAALLQDPQVLYTIVRAVRQAVPANMVVSAKMRLGYNDDTLAEECAQAIEAGGASELVVHARTKAQAYKAPAYWDRIADIRAAVSIPLIANGEIWTVEDARVCMRSSSTSMLMLGRGLVADPVLAGAILRMQEPQAGEAAWGQVTPLIAPFWQVVRSQLDVRAQAGRLKQWLNFMRRRYPEAQEAYDQLKSVTDLSVFDAWCARQSTTYLA
jgi:tRNA-dihydrouridine synthase C